MVGGSHKYFNGTVAAFRLLLRHKRRGLDGAPNTKALQIYWGDRGNIQLHASHEHPYCRRGLDSCTGKVIYGAPCVGIRSKLNKDNS